MKEHEPMQAHAYGDILFDDGTKLVIKCEKTEKIFEIVTNEGFIDQRYREEMPNLAGKKQVEVEGWVIFNDGKLDFYAEEILLGEGKTRRVYERR
jgi:hypothetical protein